VESFRFVSHDELARQSRRMTKADLALHEKIQAFHVAEAPPLVSADSANGVVWTRATLAARLDMTCDRVFDELINVSARVRGVRNLKSPRPRDYIL
jgi:hypothetical protein